VKDSKYHGIGSITNGLGCNKCL